MPLDTRPLIWEEKMVLDFLRDRRGNPIKTWTAINQLARQWRKKKWMPKHEWKSSRSVLVPLLCRLIKEKKVIRHRTNETIRISEAF